MPVLDCGIDIGSTNVKVVLIDGEGRVAATRVAPSPRVPDGAGVATDAAALVELIEAMIIDAWREAGGGAALRSLATAGVGEDGIGVTGDLVPTGHAIPWFDKRAMAEAEWLARSEWATAQSGNLIGPDRTIAKWLWLRRNRPQELAEARWWIALTDYPAAWWSGRPFMSCSLAPRTACFDVFSREWIEPLLQVAHAPTLPLLLTGGEIIGGVRGGRLRESGAVNGETLVVAGGHDHPVGATVLRRLDPNARVDSLGTANLVYGETARRLSPQLDPYLALSIPPRGNPGCSCLGVLEFSAALEPVRTDEALFQALLREDHFSGAPDGLVTGEASAVERIRLAIEDLSLEARRTFAAMGDLGVPVAPIYATGGWSRSRALVELRASVFGEPIHVVDDVELTATGAAILAAETVSGEAVRIAAHLNVKRVDPLPAWRTAYEQRFAQTGRNGDRAS